MLEALKQSDFVLGLFIPWGIWVTVSLFNQRQEIALLKQILKVLTPKKCDPESELE